MTADRPPAPQAPDPRGVLFVLTIVAPLYMGMAMAQSGATAAMSVIATWVSYVLLTAFMVFDQWRD